MRGAVMRCSVAMTTYNGRDYVERQLDSIRTQTILPDEVLISDDGSTDGTVEFVRNYIEKNNLKNWIIWQNEQNLGWKANFRKVLGACEGDLIFLCDQDDIWLPEKIEDMKRIMEIHAEILLLISNYTVRYDHSDENIRTAGISDSDGTLEFYDLKKHHLDIMRPGCTYCARKGLIRQMLAHDIPDAGHDAMLWRYAIIQDGLYLYRKPLIIFCRHEGNATTSTADLTLKGHVNQLNWLIENGMFFSRYLKRRHYFYDNEKYLEKYTDFLKERKQHLINGSIPKMMLFQLTHRNNYTTMRNLLSDDLVIIKNRHAAQKSEG